MCYVHQPLPHKLDDAVAQPVRHCRTDSSMSRKSAGLENMDSSTQAPSIEPKNEGPAEKGGPTPSGPTDELVDEGAPTEATTSGPKDDRVEMRPTRGFRISRRRHWSRTTLRTTRWRSTRNGGHRPLPPRLSATMTTAPWMWIGGAWVMWKTSREMLERWREMWR